jgi:hypothetical protein
MDDFSLFNALELLRALGEPEDEDNGTAFDETDFSAFAASFEETLDPLETTRRRRSTTSSQMSGIDLQSEDFNDFGEGKSPRWSKNLRPHLPSLGTEGVVSSILRDIQSPKAMSSSGTEAFSKAYSVSNSTATTIGTEDTQISRDNSYSNPFACPPSTSSKTILRRDSSANNLPSLVNSGVKILSKPSMDLTIDAEHPEFNLQKTLRLLRSLDVDDPVSFKENSSATRGDYDLDEPDKRDTIVSSIPRDVQSPKAMSSSGTGAFSKAYSVSNSTATTIGTDDTQISRDNSYSNPFVYPPSTSSKAILRSDSTGNNLPSLVNSGVKILSKPSMDLTIDAEHPEFNLQKTLRLLRSLDVDDPVSFKENSSATRGDYDLDEPDKRGESDEKTESGVELNEDPTQRSVSKKSREGLSYREPAVRENELQAVNEMIEADKMSVGKVDIEKENSKDDQSDSHMTQPEVINPQAALLAFNQHVRELMAAIGEPEEEGKRDEEIESDSLADEKYTRFRSEFREYQENNLLESNLKNAGNYITDNDHKIDYSSDDIGVKTENRNKMGLGCAKTEGSFSENDCESGESGSGRSSPFNEKMQGNTRQSGLHDHHNHNVQNLYSSSKSNFKNRMSRNGSSSNSNSNSNISVSNFNNNSSSSGSVSHSKGHTHRDTAAHGHTKGFTGSNDYINKSTSEKSFESVFMNNICTNNFNSNSCNISNSAGENTAKSTSSSSKIGKYSLCGSTDLPSNSDFPFVGYGSNTSQNTDDSGAFTMTVADELSSPTVVNTRSERSRDDESETKT